MKEKLNRLINGIKNRINPEIEKMIKVRKSLFIEIIAVYGVVLITLVAILGLIPNTPTITIKDYLLVGGFFGMVLLKQGWSMYKIQKDFKTFKQAYNSYKADDNNFKLENIKDLKYMLEDEKLNDIEINELINLIDKDTVISCAKEKGYLNIMDVLKIKEEMDKVEKEKEHVAIFITENNLEQLNAPKVMFQHMI